MTIIGLSWQSLSHRSLYFLGSASSKIGAFRLIPIIYFFVSWEAAMKIFFKFFSLLIWCIGRRKLQMPNTKRKYHGLRAFDHILNVDLRHIRNNIIIIIIIIIILLLLSLPTLNDQVAVLLE